MSTRLFNSSTLRKIRDKIISTLRQKDVLLQTHYQLSKVNEVHPSFNLSLVLKSTSAPSVRARIGKIGEYLLEEFPKMTIQDIGNQSVRLDMSKVYDKMSGSVSSSKRKNDEPTKRPTGRPTENLSLLQHDIEDVLKTHTKLTKGDTGMGYVFLPRNGKCREISLRFKNKFAYLEGLRCLESGYAGQIKIVDGDKKWIFSISPDPIVFGPVQTKAREDAVVFFIYLKKAVRELEEKAVVLSSFIDFSLQGSTKEILIQCNDSSKALLGQKAFSENFKVEKDGTLLHLRFSERTIKNVIQDRIIKLNLPKVTKGLVTSSNGVGNQVYVHSSTNYEEFHFLPFNRKTTNKHVLDLVQSVKMFGVLTFVVVVETDVVDGVMRKWVVDGQHRFKAYKYEGYPILYTKAHASTMHDLVRLIAKLNHTSKQWSLLDYLNAWTSLGISEYNQLRNAYTKTHLPLTLLLQIYQNKVTRTNEAQAAFCDGRFKIENMQIAEQQIAYLTSAQSLLPKSRDLYTGLLQVIRKYDSTYDHKKMLSNLRKLELKLPFAEGDEISVITKKFDDIYQEAA